MIIVDSNGLGYRSFHALKAMASKEGNVATGITFGFVWAILRLFERFQDARFVFCWDSGGKRQLIFPEYKAKRKPQTEAEQTERQAIYAQFDALRNQILPAMGFTNQLHCEGYESDDLIASVVGDARYAAIPTTIISSDHDLYQLLRHRQCQITAGPEAAIVTRNSFFLKYGIKPGRWPAVKAIAGCPSDGVPGVPGVGELTAIKFLKDELPASGKKWRSIASSSDIIFRNARLVLLPFAGTPQFELKQDSLTPGKIREVLSDLDFQSCLSESNWRRWEAFGNGNPVANRSVGA